MDVERFLEEASAFEGAQDGFCVVGISGLDRERSPFTLGLVGGQRIDVPFDADREAIFQILQAVLVTGGTIHRPGAGGPGPVPEQLDDHGVWVELLHDFGGYLHLLDDFHPGLGVISISTDQQAAFVRMGDGDTARDFEVPLAGGKCPFGVPLELAAVFAGSTPSGS